LPQWRWWDAVALQDRRIVEAPTRWPSLSSSPWILTYPQRGFSRAIRTTKATMTSSIGGLWVPRTVSPSLISAATAGRPEGIN